ncbi:hypothetical protein GCM10027091_17520 [Streptomyces daliensis]
MGTEPGAAGGLRYVSGWGRVFGAGAGSPVSVRLGPLVRCAGRAGCVLAVRYVDGRGRKARGSARPWGSYGA